MRRARRRRAGAARRGRPRRRPLRAGLPALRAGARPSHGARGRAARPAQRLRGDEARAGAPLRGVRHRDRRAGHRAALPQRLRPADAARHAVRRRREHLPLRATPPGARRACSRTAASGATSSTSATSRARTSARSRRPSRCPGRSTSRAARRARCSTWRTRSRRACDAPPGAAPRVTGEWRAGDVRHVVASPALAAERLGFRAEEDFDAGMAELAAAPLRALARQAAVWAATRRQSGHRQAQEVLAQDRELPRGDRELVAPAPVLRVRAAGELPSAALALLHVHGHSVRAGTAPLA